MSVKLRAVLLMAIEPSFCQRYRVTISFLSPIHTMHWSPSIEQISKGLFIQLHLEQGYLLKFI